MSSRTKETNTIEVSLLFVFTAIFALHKCKLLIAMKPTRIIKKKNSHSPHYSTMMNLIILLIDFFISRLLLYYIIIIIIIMWY